VYKNWRYDTRWTWCQSTLIWTGMKTVLRREYKVRTSFESFFFKFFVMQQHAQKLKYVVKKNWLCSLSCNGARVVMPCKHVKMCSAYPWKHKFSLRVRRLSCTSEILKAFFFWMLFSVSKRKRISFQQHSSAFWEFISPLS